MTRGSQFAALIHNILVMGEEHRADNAAKAIGLTYDSLFARIHNRVMFSPEEIKSLIAAVPDIRIPAWLLEGSDFVVGRRIGPSTSRELAEESLRHSSIMMMVEAGEAAHEIEKAISDHRIDHREALQIQKDIEAAEQAIATVREHVKRLTR